MGEVGYCQSGIGFPEREQGRKKGIPFYKVSDMTLIGNELIMVTSNNYVSEEQILKNRWKVINSIPAIIFAKVGAALLLDRKRLVLNSFLIDNNTMAYILNEKWDYYFCKTLFDTIYLPQLSQVGALPSFNGKDVENLNVIIPKSKEEQTAIGNFFKQLDETIALHRRNCIKFQNLKTAYLENIFSAKYIQNKDKNKNAWEQRKLGDIAEIVMGQSPNSGNYTNNPKDHILVQGNADIKNGKVFPRIWTTQITKIGKKNDLIMSVRAPVGDMAKTDYDVVLGRGVCAIKGNEFIYQILSKMKIDGYWNALSTGSTFDAINSNDIKKTLISIPKEQEEQTTIGNFFKQLDDTIALHQRFWMNNNQLGREYAELF
ncbi:MAG: restriction endonuclease subunit S [[Actinobacillus] rossii]|nr:restriction endonuclease subunit S [[Actinobacillus] rossii]